MFDHFSTLCIKGFKQHDETTCNGMIWKRASYYFPTKYEATNKRHNVFKIGLSAYADHIMFLTSSKTISNTDSKTCLYYSINGAVISKKWKKKKKKIITNLMYLQ